MLQALNKVPLVPCRRAHRLESYFANHVRYDGTAINLSPGGVYGESWPCLQKGICLQEETQLPIPELKPGNREIHSLKSAAPLLKTMRDDGE